MPSSYTPYDPDEINAFVDEGIIQSMDPGRDAVAIANEFQSRRVG